jgi:hypothetical protein
MSRIIRRTLIPLAVLALAGSARAQDTTPGDRADPASAVSVVNMNDTVPGAGGVTYLDLVRQIVGDIELGSSGMFEGHHVIDFRHIGGAEWQTKPPTSVDIFRAEVLPIRSGGEDRLALLVSLEQEGSGRGNELLALYSLGSSPTLLDAVDVGFDNGTSFFDPSSLSLGEGKTALLMMGTEEHRGESHHTTALILFRKNRLQLVDTIETLSVVGCGNFVRDEVPEFRVVNDGGRAYPDIVATVTQTIAVSNNHSDYCSALYDDVPPTPGMRVFSVTYSWDETASKYNPDPGAFDKHREEDEDRL